MLLWQTEPLLLDTLLRYVYPSMSLHAGPPNLGEIVAISGDCKSLI